MWLDDLAPGASWTGLWSGYIICGNCGGIRRLENNCPACNAALPIVEEQFVMNNGSRIAVPKAVYMGAEGRYEDYIYLGMLEREWKRPLLETDNLLNTGIGKSPSPKAAIVLLFWSYFESRIERLLRTGMNGTPSRLVEDALDRYSSIGSRLDRLYRVVFGTTYSADLKAIGYDFMWTYLHQIQQQRNAFIHGDPTAIDDTLVAIVVEQLKNEHEAWIAVFNKHKHTAHNDSDLPSPD